MAQRNHKIGIEVGYSLDKAGLQEVINSLQTVISLTKKDLNAGNLTEGVRKAKEETKEVAQQMQSILNASWNPKLNQLDLSKVNQAIKATYGNMGNLQKKFEAMGEVGERGYNAIAREILNTNLQLKQSSKLLDDMAVSMGNTIKWGLTSSVFNNLTNSLQKAWDFSKGLDSSLNDIRIVTGKSADEMARFAKTANTAASRLGASTRDFTEAALIYYQQGDSDTVANAKAEITLKTANVTGQSAEEVSEQLTAVWNGYKVDAEQAELYIDKLAAVAATTASDLEELATGMSKVASAANLMGVDIDQLNAALATVVSVTRQAPESVGTAFKTIYARMGDIEAGLDAETTLGSYTEQMKEIAGIDILSANGKLRDMGDVIEEIGGKWHLYSREQQIALSQVMAGTRQYNNLLSLFDNWDMYTDALRESKNAAGTLSEQNEIYLDRIDAKLQQLSTSWEGMYNTLFDTEAMGSFLDMAIEGVEALNRVVGSLGGGLSSIQGILGGIVTLLNKQIARHFEQSLENIEKRRNNLAGEELKKDIIRQNVAKGRTGMSENSIDLQAAYSGKILSVKDALTEDEATALIQQQEELGIIQDKIDKLNEYKDIFNKVKEEESALFKKVNDADNVTQDQFAEAIAQNADNVTKLKKQNDELDGLLNQLKESKQMKFEYDADGAVLGTTYDMASDHIGLKKTPSGNLTKKDQKKQEKLLKIQEAAKEKIVKLQKNFNKESAEHLKLQEKIVKIENKEFLIAEDIMEIDEIQNSLADKKLKIQQQLEKGAEGIAEAESGARENLELELKARKDIIDQQVIQKERQLAISNAVSAAGQMTTLDSAAKGAGEAFAEWKNGTRSLASALQTLIIPMVTMFGIGMKLTKAIQAYSTIQSASILKTGLEVAAKAKLNGATAEEIIMKTKETLVAQGRKRVTDEQVAAILVEEKVLKKKQVDNTRVILTEELMQKVQKKGTATTLANAAAWWAHPIIAIAAATALVAVAAGFAAVSAAMERNTEVQMENNSATIETEKENQKEIKSILEKYNSYHNLYLKYKEGKVANEEMAKASEDLIDVLGRESVVVKTLRGDYESLHEEMLKARQEEADKLVKSAGKRFVSASSNLRLGVGKDKEAKYGFIPNLVGLGDVKEKDGEYIINWDFGGALSTKDEEKIQEALYRNGMSRKTEDGTGYYVNQGSLEATNQGIVDYYYKMQDIKENFDTKYGMTADEWESSEIAQHIEALLKEWKPLVTEFEDSEESLDEAAATEAGYDAGFDKVDDFTTFDRNYEAYIAKLKEYGVKDTEKFAEGFFTNYTEAALEAYDARGVRKALAENLEVDLGAINEAATGLSNADIKLLGSEVDNIDDTGDLKNYVAKVKAQSRDGQIKKQLGYADSAIGSLMDDKELTEEQITDLQKLEKEYSELGEIQDRNSREYLEKLYQIKQALEDEAIAGKEAVTTAFITDAQQLLEKGVSTEGLEEFRETLKEICEADYEVLVKVESDIQSDFDSVIGVMENIDEMASKIGENFIVAAEDLEELNDMFPGILENAEILADGTMQLDREIVASKMDAAQAEVQADTDKTVEKLQNQQAELLAKRDAAQQIADIAGAMVEGEALTVEQESLMNEALNTLKADNAEITAEYEKDTQKDVTDTSKANSEIMALNFSGAYKKMAEDSEKWAKAAKQNMLVATTGRGATTSGDINTAYSAKGSPGTVATATKGELKGPEEINKTTNWADVQQYYSDLASNYNAAAINVQGKIAEILARNVKFNDRTAGISAGRGVNHKTASGKDKEPIEAEKDIYHDINIELENIANNLKLVESEAEKLTGQNLINNLAEQYKLLNKQIDATAEKLAIAHGEQAALQAQLGSLGVAFNPDGTIANYSTTFDRLLGAAQANPNDEAAVERFKVFEELVDKYDNLITGTIPELIQSMHDDMDKQMELKLQAFHYEIGLRIDISEAVKDWNEFKRDILDNIDEDDILGGALASLKDYSDFLNNDLLQTNTEHIQDIITQLKDIEEKGEASIYHNNKAQALEDLKTYYEQMMEDLTYLHDKEDEIHESYLDMLDEAQDRFDQQIEALDTISSIIEHDKNIINMIYGEEAYGMMSKFFDKQEEVNLQQLDFLNKQIAFWQAERDAAEEGSEEWMKANENMLSAIDEFNSTLEDSIQNIKDKYLNTINEIFQNLNNKVTGGMGLDYTNTEWDLINRNADQYLDTVNAIYKVQELQNKYLDAIEKTDSPAQQKKLNDLMQQETNYLREQDKLSEYDLERANLKYELALKQMALEEAQQNKTKLRLRRDSQGNYTYQYTQDDDQIASIQSEIANLYNQLYNLDAEQYKGNLQEIYDIWEEFQEQMAEAAQINDPEQRAAKELLIKQQYSDLINGLVEKNENLQANLYQSTMSHLFDLYEQNTANYADMSEDQKEILDMFINAETDLNGAAFDNMFNLYNTNIEQFKSMTEEQQDILMSSMVPQWTSGIQAMADVIIGEGGLNGVCKDAFEDLHNATAQFEKDLTQIETNAGQTFKEIAEGGNNAYDKVKDLVEENNKLIESCSTEVEAIKNVINELDLLIAKYDEVIKAARDAATKGYDYWTEENKKNAEVDSNLDRPEDDTQAPAENTSAPASASTEPAKPSLNYGSYISVKPGVRWYADSYGGGSSGIARAGSISYINPGAPYAYNIGGLGWVRKSDIVGYDTGGYTGDWNNNNGRLAMLHQKELVLNANDTSNMLNAITILRDITANLGATLLNKMAAISAGGASSIGQGLAAAGMEQTVTINAEFPNATSSKEIEDALNNLVNRASQHITK